LFVAAAIYSLDIGVMKQDLTGLIAIERLVSMGGRGASSTENRCLQRSLFKLFRCCSKTLIAIILTTALAACTEANSAPPDPVSSAENKSLNVVWDKGYVIEEDEAIQKAIRDWEQKSNIKAKTRLSFYNSGEIAPKTLRSKQAGVPPDILFAAKSLYPVSDWRGKLMDVSDIVESRKGAYSADALASARLYGKQDQHYYAVPIGQGTTHIYYWKDLLQQAGYRPEDIPSDWGRFWSFWKTAQTRLRKQGSKVYGLGLPISAGAKDTYYIFEHILNAYDVQLLDAQGQLQVDRPEVRQGIIRCLNWYIQFYREGSSPPETPKWLDPGNNRALLNRTVLMTPNPTLSIPAAVHNDPNTYFKNLGTVAFPKKPNGEPMTQLVMVRQAVIFANAPHAAEAKAFLSYLTQPPVLDGFLKSSFGRFLPFASEIKRDPFWLNPADPHISTVSRTIAAGHTAPYHNVLNPAYGIFLEENVWGEVLHKMAVEQLPAEAAADHAITRLKEIFAQQQ
jgi:multiple sugar transport system substrate-binding protein